MDSVENCDSYINIPSSQTAGLIQSFVSFLFLQAQVLLWNTSTGLGM
jgi:hypothetical protein